MKENTTQIIGYFAIAIILISLFFIGAKITGFVTTTDNQTGVVNVTISASGALEFTTALLDFGTGTVIPPAAGATLASDGAGTNTSWTGVKTTGELVLRNSGNTNLEVDLSTNGSVADFIGGSSPTFSAMVTNSSGNSTSCVAANFSGSYATIDQTRRIACSTLSYGSNIDSIDINFQLYIPSDATGAKTIGIVAIGTY